MLKNTIEKELISMYEVVMNFMKAYQGKMIGKVKVMADINVAIVGCGLVAKSHFAAWRRIPYAKVVAICDTNEKAAERAARVWKIPRRFNSVSEMIDFKEITLWDICTPIQTHMYLANQAMKNGFDALIEKPLAITSKNAKEIVECQKATGQRAGVIHNWLFEPPVLKAQAIVRQGDIGEIIGAHIEILHPIDEPMTSNKDHWSHKLPGGRFSEMLIHPIYLLRSFLGAVEVENVKVSKVGAYPWMEHDELLATFIAGKKLAGAYASFNAPRYAIFIDLFGRKGIAKLDIVNATVNVLPSIRLKRLSKAMDSLNQAVQLSTSTFRNAIKIASRQWFDGHEMCIRLFAESLIDEKEPPVTLEEAYEVVKVLEDAYRLIETN